MSTILTADQLAVVRLLYRDGFTQQETADELGKTQQRVSQLHATAIAIMEKEKNIVFDL